MLVSLKNVRQSDKKNIRFTENWSWTKYLFDVIGVLLLIERITDKSQTFKCGPLADYFLEMNEVKLLLQGKADSVLSQW